MRVLVYPHDLGIGGSQINAIDLAAGVAKKGHDVIVYGKLGPLVDYIERLGLKFIPANQLKYRPAPTRIAQLASIARKERLDLIHAYEWPPCLDAYFGAGLIFNLPVLSTVLGMTLMPYVPASVPLIMGTAELGDEARKEHRGDVWVLEPPIDVTNDHPGIDGKDFRQRHGVKPEELLVVTVSRLAIDLKLDALVRAIDAADILADKYPIRLILVGDGLAYDALNERARSVNQRWAREVITLVGVDLDPRQAYAAADVVVGMGSSTLRALAIGRPVVVQGEKAFSEIFEPATLELFLRQGFYGLADDVQDAQRLAGQIADLLKNPERREMLGKFGRQVVTERFSLERAVRIQLNIYEEVLRCPTSRHFIDALKSAYRAFMLEVENHDPRRKKERRLFEEKLLAAARHGLWPPEYN
ncbi:MAG: glycosyltransferase family 4 protein [Nitrososphaera sp.]|nr:glycosyltransferase family 4 protein [Nitrososphaera sp.]